MSDTLEIILLDIDGSVALQKRLLAQYQPIEIPLQKQAEALRYWCSPREMDLLREILLGAFQSNLPKLLLYGSGDYHHLAYLGISLIEEPFTLIQFDTHTDLWKPLKSDYFDFSSWVTRAIRIPNLQKVIQLGVDSDLRLAWYLPFPQGRYSHELDLLLQGKVDIYPNTTHRSILLGNLRAHLPCVEFEPFLIASRATWKNMRDYGGVEETIRQLLSNIPTPGVYITIDKDVIRESENFAAYPKRQGTLTLDDLLLAISLIVKNKRLVGADICGDGSHISIHASLAKRLMLWQQSWMLPNNIYTSPETISKNEKANMQIVEQLCQSSG